MLKGALWFSLSLRGMWSKIQQPRPDREAGDGGTGTLVFTWVPLDLWVQSQPELDRTSGNRKALGPKGHKGTNIKPGGLRAPKG